MGVSMITSLALVIHYPTLSAAPHILVNGYKNLLAIAVETDYSFPLADKVKEYLEDPNKFVAVAPGDAAGGPAPAAPEVSSVKEEPAEESDDDMGLSLFD